MALFSHLLAHDITLMQEFLNAYPDRYRSIEFDVHVGTGRDPGDSYDLNIRTMAIGLSQRRIDAVGLLSGSIEIVEVTQVADIKALGQLLAYVQLYAKTFNPTYPLSPVLVARQIGTDLSDCYALHGIQTFLFPEPSPRR